MITPSIIPAKYIYLDVVGFTRNRSVEAQTHIIDTLNNAVKECLKEFNIQDADRIFSATGDGICIVLLNIINPYDIHILITLSILKKIHLHNEKDEDEMRKFKIRIGINANEDNLITDINGIRNIAGAGINLAARVMSVAGENQIFVSASVYEILRYREVYMKSFHYHWKTVKHGLNISVYQYIQNHEGLNTDTPTTTKAEKKKEKLSLFMAYYIAHAIKNRNFFLERMENYNSYEGKILLWFLAIESEKHAKANEVEKKYIETHNKSNLSLEERYELYDKQDWNLKGLAVKVIDAEVRKANYFEDYDQFVFVTEEGIKKLKMDYPNICKEFGIE